MDPYYIARDVSGRWGIFELGRFNEFDERYCVDCGLLQGDAERRCERMNVGINIDGLGY